MSIRVTCEACRATTNAPDTLAGKKVKCPKCAAVVAVPEAMDLAEPALAPPPKAAMKAAPRRDDRRDEAADPPLFSYEELQIPPRLRKKIEKEAGDEEVLWIGRQDPASRLRKARVGVYAGIGLAVFGTVILVLTFIMADKAAAKEGPKEAPKEVVKEAEKDAPKEAEKEGAKSAKKGKAKGKAVDPEEAKAKAAAKAAAQEEAKAKAAEKDAAREEARARKAAEDRNLIWLVGGGFAGLIWLMALPLLCLPLLTRRFMHNRDCYVITDSRALIIGYVRNLSFTRGELAGREVEVRPDGVGNIRMGYVQSSQFQHGTGRNDFRTETRRESVGFLDVADVEAVERFLRQKLRLSEPKSHDQVR